MTKNELVFNIMFFIVGPSPSTANEGVRNGWNGYSRIQDRWNNGFI